MRLRRGVNMREYLISMIGVCAVCFIVKELGVIGDNKYVGFVCGLCVVAVTVSPLLRLTEWIYSFDMDVLLEDSEEKYEEYSSYFDSFITESYISEAEDEIEKYICNGYGLLRENVDARIYFSEDEYFIYISLTGKGVFANTNKMKAELLEKYGCGVEIVIGE